ncbi:hypothetical protein JTE90_007440 [Oedothorax gibbosus]|uniref:Uncharacterized protein n=1 Tax=Oedothorax gibbosus TaxID=931172 RepID=A0AAV6UQQ1_9ARAC|nr:hypothetical protein JTE90_007440 [Oedothorax gibbosus]
MRAVLLLEAGGRKTPITEIPAAAFLVENTGMDWRKKFKSVTPEEQFTGKANGENFRLQMKTRNGYRQATTMLKNEGI